MKQETKGKRYKNAVKRRLNLPKEVKDRLISDLNTTIAVRMEQGESWETVRKDLGSPKEVAARYMEQMQEYAYRKSPWRFLFAAGAVYGGGKLLGNALGRILPWVLTAVSRPANSLGVIGGADGPTAIFVTYSREGHVLLEWGLPVVALALGIWGYCRLRKCNK